MFALTIVALFGPSVNSIVVVIVSTFPSYARLVRTQVMSREFRVYRSAAHMGSSLPRILHLHILPNVIGPVLIVASMDVPLVIGGVEAGLSFLGLGVRPPTPSWGSI